MPDIADVAWSERDDRNSEAVPDGWPQGTMPAYVDETGRMMMGATKRFWNKINPIYQTSGTGDDYIVQTEVGVDQINLYELLCVRIDQTNVGTTPTLQFGATNSRTIVKAGPSGYIPLIAGDLFAGNSHTFWYNGAFYVLTDPATPFGGPFQPLSTNLTTWAAVPRAAGYDNFAATPTSANLRALVSDESGTGNLLFQSGDLGTPTAGVLTNATGLPIGTGVSGLAANMATFLAGGTSAQLRAAMTDESGTGALLFQNGALGTPASGVATNLTGLPLTTGVTGTLGIGNGGTGQATASAAFDALSPTTTRGDLIFRNATTNARLAAGTSGYALIAAGAGADPAWVGFIQTGTSPSTRTWNSKASDFVSILDFGAIGDGNIANAAVNATALTNALATGKTVWIPYSAAGYHFGTNTITLGTGQKIVGEDKVVLLTTTTTMMFSCTGYGQDWGVSNVKIDATGCGSSSTIFRFRTAAAVVYRGRFDNIDFLNQYEAFGDEASANYVVDIRFTNIAFLLSLGRPIYLRHSRGFIYWENIQHSLNTSARATSWECGRFEDAVGLEITRWDCSGGPLVTNSTVTISIASPGVVTWTGHNLVAGDAIRLTTTGALPTGLAVATTYFVKTVVDANNFTLSATSGGAVINTSGTQSGIHTATRAPVYQASAYGLVVTTSTSVWLNRVEVDSTWGNGIILSTIRFLRTNQVSAYHNLGNQITCSAITESAYSDTIITGAAGDIGDGGGGGISFDTASNNIVISNLDVTNTTASGLTLNNVTNVLVSNYNGYSNTGFGLALLGTTDRCIIACNLNANTAGTVLNTASGSNNFVNDIASNQLPATTFRGKITPVSTTGIAGTVTNDNAIAGSVGEYVESVIALGSAVALTTGTAKDVTTISLTAGDWDVEYVAQFTGGTTTTVTYIVASISTTTNTQDQTNGRYVSQPYSGSTVFNNVPGAALGMGAITVRMSLSATTTIRAVATAVFGTSTCSGYGLLRARRVR